MLQLCRASINHHPVSVLHPSPCGVSVLVMQQPSGIGITAIGAYAPPKVVTNADYEQHLETSAEWIESRTGIRERRYAADDEFTSDMGVRAVQDLLGRYPQALEGVDMVICATATPDASFPATATLIAAQIGLHGVGGFDLSAACSGFLYACAAAQGLVAAGINRRVLVIGAEVFTKIVDQTDRATAILFGDGAGAAVIEQVPQGYGFQGFVLGSDGAGAASLYAPCLAPKLPDGTVIDSRYTVMNGREVFKFAVRIIPESGQQVMDKSGLKVSDIDWFIPHQANIRIIESACERFRLPLERTIVNLDRYGNTSAATVPLALSEAVADGRIQDGQQLLMVAFGGGLSWAACTMKWYAGNGVQDL